jgi:FdhD protein
VKWPLRGSGSGSSVEVRIVDVREGISRPRFDRIATEEPLEIRLRAGGATRTVAITMRTPGNDFELAAGFLYSEGVLADHEALLGMSFCLDRDVDVAQRYNIVNVDLAATALPELLGLERHFTTTSACGVCGKATLEALTERGIEPIELESQDLISPSTIASLPEKLRAAQGVFEQTGGLHAAGLFDFNGERIGLREDVGRHNAVDKVIGWALIERALPLDRRILLVSGRASYEILQKAVVARVPVVCAVSAPSSLAVDLARAFNVTLIGFLRGRHFNVYAGAERVASA